MFIVLTGAGGFFGSHVLDALLAETSYEVICVDSLQHNGLTPNVRDVRDRHSADTWGRVTFITHDLRVPFAPIDEARVTLADYVINAASLCQVEQSIAHPRWFIDNNIRIMLTMLDLARRMPTLRRFIHISTDEVYGPHGGDTTTDYEPSSPYAASKAAQEVIGNAYSATYGLPLTVVNCANMFGPRQSQLAFTPQVIRKVLESELIRVHTTKSGRPGWRNYAYAPNVARHIVHRLLAHDDSGIRTLPRRVQLGGHTQVDNLELVTRIGKILEMPPNYELVPGADDRPGWDATYAAFSDTDWDPRTHYDAALGETVDWFVSHREWLDAT